MQSWHPEPYLPLAFFVIMLVNLTAVTLLVVSKGIRSWRARRREERIARVIETVASTDVAPLRELKALPLSDLREVAERLHRRSHPDLCDRLCRHLGKTGRLKRVVRAAAKGGTWRRIDALISLGFLRHPPALPLLRNALSDPDEEVILASVAALASWDAPESLELLVRLLRSDSPVNPSRVAAAIETSKTDISGLLTEAARSSDAVTAYWAATLLGRYPSPPVRAKLSELTRQADPNVRAAAFSALAAAADPSCHETLRAGLDDREWFVRAQAARACGAQRVATALPRLTSLLRDPEWWVRADAREAIEAMGPAAVDHLLRMLDDKDRFARNMAAEALDNIGFIDATIWDLQKGGIQRERAVEILRAVRRAEGAPALAEKIRRLDPSLFERMQETLSLSRSA